MAENCPTPIEVLNTLQVDIERYPFAYKAEEIGRLGAFVGSVIESHNNLPRAMEYGRNLIKATVESGQSFPSGMVIVADSLTQSKGRFSRAWHAPIGGAWGCMVHANTLQPQSRSLIPFAVGVSCCEVLRDYGVSGSSVRWVNDVLVGGMKLAGFLVEAYTEPVYGEEFTLVGFGININNSVFPPELSGLAVALCDILQKNIDLSQFTAHFLAKLAFNFGILYHEDNCELRGESLTGKDGGHLLLEKWLKLSDTVGQNVLYGFDVMNAPQYRAKVVGLDDSGGLRLQLEDGFEKVEYSGEVRYLSPEDETGL